MNLILSIYIGNYFFVGPSNSYSVLLPEDVKLYQIDTLDGAIVNYTFIGTNKEKDFDFSLSFSVVESEIKNLLMKENIDKYKKDCNCKVEKGETIEYNNFNGMKYIIFKYIQNVKFAGLVYTS